MMIRESAVVPPERDATPPKLSNVDTISLLRAPPAATRQLSTIAAGAGLRIPDSLPPQEGA
jgi:hypothetical protein